MADIAELIVALKLRDGISSGLGKLNSQLSGMQGNLSRVGRGVGQVGTGLNQLGTRAAFAAGGGIAYVAHAAIEFEDAFTGVAKTVDASEAELAALSDSIREMAREMPIGTTELAALAETAGALGIAVSDIDEFTRVTALLGTTTNVASEDAANALGQLSNVLGLTGADYERFASTLVDLGNKGASTEADILAITARAGAAGDLIGLSADQVLAFGSAVANMGIEAEAGGSALQKFFIETLTNLQDDDTLKIMADTAGTTGQAFKKAFEDDASGALEVFLTGLGKLDEAAQIETLQSLGFNDVRITRMLLGFANNTDNLTDSLNTAEAAFKANTALQDEAERKFANTASQIKILQNNVKDAAITVGNELLPVIADLSKDLVNFLNQDSTQQGLKDFATGLAEGIRGLAGELKGTDFSGIIGGMKLAAGVAKGAFDAFRALPEPIQQLAIAALVANKVSGGAVGNIAKGLANILIGTGGLLSKGGSPANPLWVAMAGGPGVGGGIPGGAGGGLLNTVKNIGAAAAIPLVGIAAVEVVNFDNMRQEAIKGLEATVDSLPRRTAADIDASIARLEGEINAERPLLDGILFNTNVKPTLEAELTELRTARAAAAQDARAHAAAVKAGAFSQINEFRRGSNERRNEANQQRSAIERAKAAIDLGRQATSGGFNRTVDGIGGASAKIGTTNVKLDTANANLRTISGKNWSPIVKIEQTNTVSSTVIQQQITQQQAIAGTGFTPGVI